MKIKREVLLGIAATCGLLLFVWGYNYLKGRDVLSPQTSFFAVFDQVEGLVESGGVMLNGVKIGQVKNIRFHPDKSGRVVIECIVSREIPIPSNSIAVLSGSGLVGDREILIRIGQGPPFLNKGDTLESMSPPPLTEAIDPLLTRAASMLEGMDTALANLNMILEPMASGGTGKDLAAFSHTLKNLNQTIGKINTLLDGAVSVTANLEKHNPQISEIIEKLNELSHSLASSQPEKLIESLGETTRSLNETILLINEGSGSAGLLLSDPALYMNLEAAARQLEFLLKDISENPGKYIRVSVFGRKNP